MMDKKSTKKRSLVNQISNDILNINAIATKRRKSEPGKTFCRKIKLKPDPTKLFSKFMPPEMKMSSERKESESSKVEYIGQVKNSLTERLIKTPAMKVWVPPLKNKPFENSTITSTTPVNVVNTENKIKYSQATVINKENENHSEFNFKSKKIDFVEERQVPSYTCKKTRLNDNRNFNSQDDFLSRALNADDLEQSCIFNRTSSPLSKSQPVTSTTQNDIGLGNNKSPVIGSEPTIQNNKLTEENQSTTTMNLLHETMKEEYLPLVKNVGQGLEDDKDNRKVNSTNYQSPSIKENNTEIVKEGVEDLHTQTRFMIDDSKRFDKQENKFKNILSVEKQNVKESLEEKDETDNKEVIKNKEEQLSKSTPFNINDNKVIEIRVYNNETTTPKMIIHPQYPKNNFLSTEKEVYVMDTHVVSSPQGKSSQCNDGDHQDTVTNDNEEKKSVILLDSQDASDEKVPAEEKCKNEDDLKSKHNFIDLTNDENQSYSGETVILEHQTEPIDDDNNLKWGEITGSVTDKQVETNKKTEDADKLSQLKTCKSSVCVIKGLSEPVPDRGVNNEYNVNSMIDDLINCDRNHTDMSSFTEQQLNQTLNQNCCNKTVEIKEVEKNIQLQNQETDDEISQTVSQESSVSLLVDEMVENEIKVASTKNDDKEVHYATQGDFAMNNIMKECNIKPNLSGTLIEDATAISQEELSGKSQEKHLLSPSSLRLLGERSCNDDTKETEKSSKEEMLSETNEENVKLNKNDGSEDNIDDFYEDIHMSCTQLIDIENEYSSCQKKNTVQNEVQNNSFYKEVSKCPSVPWIKKPSPKLESPHCPPIKWVKKAGEEKQTLRALILEISKANAMIEQARREIWPKMMPPSKQMRF